MELATMDLGAETALRHALKSHSQEVRDRAAQLLKEFEPASNGFPAAYLCAIRAVEVLERIASTEARVLLTTWAKEHAGTILGREAEAATSRLATQK